MLDMDKILDRLSVPGLILLVLGAVLGYGSRFLAQKVFPKQEEKAALTIKWVGLAMALLAALILLDFIKS